jgi:hypothetical protein
MAAASARRRKRSRGFKWNAPAQSPVKTDGVMGDRCIGAATVRKRLHKLFRNESLVYTHGRPLRLATLTPMEAISIDAYHAPPTG